MEKSSLQEAIDRTAHASLQDSGITPTPDFDEHMARAMGTALDRMEEEGALGDEEKVQQAEANTIILVTAIAEEAHVTGSATADAGVFSRALRRVCPLYPFC